MLILPYFALVQNGANPFMFLDNVSRSSRTPALGAGGPEEPLWAAKVTVSPENWTLIRFQLHPAVLCSDAGGLHLKVDDGCKRSFALRIVLVESFRDQYRMVMIEFNSELP